MKKPHAYDVYVGQRVRVARDLRRISQEKLADHLNLTFQQVQKYEKGANRIGSGRLFVIAQFFNLPVSFFFDGIEEDYVAPDAPQLQPGEADLLRVYRKAGPELQTAARAVLKSQTQLPLRRAS